MHFTAATATAALFGVPIGFVLQARGQGPGGYPQAIKATPRYGRRSALLSPKCAQRQKDLILEAEDEKLRLQREAEAEVRQLWSKLRQTSSACSPPATQQLHQRADVLEQRDRKLIDREREPEEGLRRGRARYSPWSRSSTLNGVSGPSAADAKQRLDRGRP